MIGYYWACFVILTSYLIFKEVNLKLISILFISCFLYVEVVRF